MRITLQLWYPEVPVLEAVDVIVLSDQEICLVDSSSESSILVDVAAETAGVRPCVSVHTSNRWYSARDSYLVSLFSVLWPRLLLYHAGQIPRKNHRLHRYRYHEPTMPDMQNQCSSVSANRPPASSLRMSSCSPMCLTGRLLIHATYYQPRVAM
jgi:hypothetical protein